jgi:hypothetical protein
MIPAVQNLTGMSLNDIIESHTGPNDQKIIYGPKTIALMTAMGYTRLGSSKLSSVVINPMAQSDPIINAGEKSVVLMWLGVCVLFLM